MRIMNKTDEPICRFHVRYLWKLKEVEGQRVELESQVNESELHSVTWTKGIPVCG